MYIPFLHFERVGRISDFIFGANGVALLCVHIEHVCCLSSGIILLIRVLPVYIYHRKLEMKRCHLYQFPQKTPFSEDADLSGTINVKCIFCECAVT